MPIIKLYLAGYTAFNLKPFSDARVRTICCTIWLSVVCTLTVLIILTKKGFCTNSYKHHY